MEANHAADVVIRLFKAEFGEGGLSTLHDRLHETCPDGKIADDSDKGYAIDRRLKGVREMHRSDLRALVEKSPTRDVHISEMREWIGYENERHLANDVDALMRENVIRMTKRGYYRLNLAG